MQPQDTLTNGAMTDADYGNFEGEYYCLLVPGLPVHLGGTAQTTTAIACWYRDPDGVPTREVYALDHEAAAGLPGAVTPMLGECLKQLSYPDLQQKIRGALASNFDADGYTAYLVCDIRTIYDKSMGYIVVVRDGADRLAESMSWVVPAPDAVYYNITRLGDPDYPRLSHAEVLALMASPDAIRVNQVPDHLSGRKVTDPEPIALWGDPRGRVVVFNLNLVMGWGLDD